MKHLLTRVQELVTRTNHVCNSWHFNKSVEYTFCVAVYTPAPAKRFVSPKNEGSLKRRRVDSTESDDEVSKHRCPFRRVYTGQIRFDFGAGIRDIMFNHTGSHFAVICECNLAILSLNR